MKKPEHTTVQMKDGLHDHRFEIAFFEEKASISQNFHRHRYEGETSFDVGHRHGLRGVTAPAPDVPDHVHEYKGTTSFDDGHVHHFGGVTGPPVETPDGGHYHIIEGETTVNGAMPHAHTYEGIAN
ncbi:YmaF family protein [Salinithrix halophila]|uniref:YmaF family protein n=1 Tax=Salinithrix halophila TaxID=1485204 RepID=A0ABV8JK48_9BACL